MYIPLLLLWAFDLLAPFHWSEAEAVMGSAADSLSILNWVYYEQGLVSREF
jgi:hypothetical protein